MPEKKKRSQKKRPPTRREREFVLHVGEGPDDFTAAVTTWPRRFGHANQEVIATAMRNGNLILVRDKSDDRVVGGVILDFSTYGRSLFVPAIWVRDGETGQPSIVRKLLEMVIKALIISGRDRLVAMRDVNADDKKAVTQFNKLAKSGRLPVNVKVTGTVNDLFGDGRKVSVTSLFIQSSDRPDLVNNVVTMSRRVVDSAIRSFRGQVVAAFCSSCKENSKDGGKEKEKEKEKDKEKEKEIGIEAPSPSTKTSVEKGSVDAVGLLDLYRELEIFRFNPHSGPGRLTPI